VEQGRWLIAQDRWREALVPLDRFAREHPSSDLLVDARALANRARLELALEGADIERSDRDETAALAELEALGREPPDLAVAAAGIARASLLWTRGDRERARSIMAQSVAVWSAAQSSSLSPEAGTLAADVAAIRRLVFQPAGGGIYDTERWLDYVFPATPPRVLLVAPVVHVVLRDGTAMRLRDQSAFQGRADVLWLSAEQRALLERILVKLGGVRTRERRFVMEPPNQPVGASMHLLSLWNEFFPARPGHWSGWDLDTYPRIWRVRFFDGDRTHAGVEVVVGNSGATLFSEKTDGVWRITGLGGFWVT
jgi:predicted nucleic acid-binding protein